MSKKQKLSGTELINDGWPVGPVLGAALAAVEALQAEGVDREEALARLNRVRESPFDYQSDPIFDTLAEAESWLDGPSHADEDPSIVAPPDEEPI